MERERLARVWQLDLFSSLQWPPAPSEVRLSHANVKIDGRNDLTRKKLIAKHKIRCLFNYRCVFCSYAFAARWLHNAHGRRSTDAR